MPKQGEVQGEDTIFGDFQSFLESIGDELWEALEGFPSGEPAPVDQGPGPRSDSSLLPVGGPDGRADQVLINCIKRSNLRTVVVRSIIRCATNDLAVSVSRAIGSSVTENRHSGTSCFVAVVPHQCSRPHVHLWHDCNPLQGMCRCRLLTPYRGKEDQGGILATRKTVPGFRPLRSIPTEEARKDGDPYFSRLLK